MVLGSSVLASFLGALPGDEESRKQGVPAPGNLAQKTDGVKHGERQSTGLSAGNRSLHWKTGWPFLNPASRHSSRLQLLGQGADEVETGPTQQPADRHLRSFPHGRLLSGTADMAFRKGIKQHNGKVLSPGKEMSYQAMERDRES